MKRRAYIEKEHPELELVPGRLLNLYKREQDLLKEELIARDRRGYFRPTRKSFSSVDRRKAQKLARYFELQSEFHSFIELYFYEDLLDQDRDCGYEYRRANVYLTPRGEAFSRWFPGKIRSVRQMKKALFEFEDEGVFRPEAISPEED